MVSSVANNPIAIPTAITPVAFSDSPPFALNHARILYDNYLLTSTASSPGGSGASLTLSPNTFDRWESPTSDYIEFLLTDNRDIDTVCIGAHNLGTMGYTLTVQYRVAALSPLIDFGVITPTDDRSIMIHLNTAINAKVIQVKITGGSGNAYIGSIYAGIALQMQRPFYGGSTPSQMSAKTEYFTNWSESGELIGRSIRRSGYGTKYSWRNISDTWYKEYFQPFVDSVKLYPAYIAWNLLEHPNDVFYFYTTADIAPSYSGSRDLMEVSFEAKGHG